MKKTQITESQEFCKDLKRMNLYVKFLLFFNWDSLYDSQQPLRGMELQEKEAQKD